MIKYKTSYDIRIEQHEVLRETDKMAVLGARTSANSTSQEYKESKRSEWQNWHDTWADAKAFLIEKAQREVDGLRAQLEKAKSKLGDIKRMRQ